MGTPIGVRVIRLHRQKRLAHADHPVSAVEIADVLKQAIVLAAHDLLTGDAAAAVRGVSHALTGHQLDIARKNGHRITSVKLRVRA